MLVTTAIVLRRSDYRDYDRMMTLLSPGYGRIDAVARGVKRPTSSLISATEMFCAGEYAFVTTKGGLTLKDCTIVESHYPIREDYDRLIHGCYLLNLILFAALPGERCDPLFELALRALAHLSYSALPPELITAMFEMHFAQMLGQSPMVSHCMHCGKPAEGLQTMFDARLGGVLCPECGRIGAGLPITEGARRIMQKAPRARFETVELLEARAEWPEAAAHIRRFLVTRVDLRNHTPPTLFGEAGTGAGARGDAKGLPPL